MLTKKEIIIPNNPPKLIIIVGPCRVGTTPLANIFTKIGLTAYMQPIKSARRAKEANEKIIPWEIISEKVALTKETVGADTPAEFFDPIQVLIHLGYPKEKLILIPIIRDPRKTLASWQEMWEQVDLQKFVKSYELTLDIKNKAEKIGIQTIPYVHEVIRDNKSDIVVKSLFDKLNLKADATSNVVDWQNDIKFGEEDSNTSKLKFYDVPPERFIKEVKNWGSYEFKEEPDLFLSPSDAEFIKSNKKLQAIYEEFRKGCEDALGVKIKPYNSIDY